MVGKWERMIKGKIKSQRYKFIITSCNPQYKGPFCKSHMETYNYRSFLKYTHIHLYKEFKWSYPITKVGNVLTIQYKLANKNLSASNGSSFFSY